MSESQLPTDSQFTYHDPLAGGTQGDFPDEEDFTFMEPDFDEDLELEAELEREAAHAAARGPPAVAALVVALVVAPAA